MRRALLWVAALLTLALAGAFVAGGWYYSDELLPAPAPDDPSLEHTVTAVDPEAGTITLAPGEDGAADLLLPTIGLLGEDGLLLASGDPEQAGGDVTRTVELLDGSWPEPGALLASSADTFDGDPASTLGLPFDVIDVPSELGDLPAWRRVPNGSASRGRWAIIVHGRGGSLTEGNRLLPTLDEMGLPSLTISVRNDPDAPVDDRGYGYFGAREWREVEAAIDHLVEVEDAREIVLIGYSQGAAASLSLLRRSERAELVSAAVLISPLASLGATLELQARNRDIPEPLIAPLLTSTRWISTARSGLDFTQVEHVDRAEELPDDVPMLLTHGAHDGTVPVEPTRELAAALADQATYAEYAATDHVREWNADRERFEEDLRTLLKTVVD
ncbi:MAG: prolyl oligopeptidase family serine peptidase [Nitriliruptoraceae bacterium]